MPSTLHSTTMQYPNNPTDTDYEHTPIIRKISNHEVMVDVSNFPHPQTKDHYIKSIALYSSRRMVDEIYFNDNKIEDIYKVIFDLDKINKKDRELCELNEWNPRDWSIEDTYHALITCNVHGNWSDVPEDYL